jgi:hypothetical protein
MFIGAMKQKKNLDGYLANNELEPQSIVSRHADLVREMKNRGWDSGVNHTTPLVGIAAISKYKRKRIDREASLNLLLSRCKKCRYRNDKDG